MKYCLFLISFFIVASASATYLSHSELSGDDLFLSRDGTPQGTQVRLWEEYGGTWHDAEKTASNTEDDLMCWAAATANILTWTGWGQVAEMTTEDEIFTHFQDHWTDQGGNAYFGVNWWFDGVNDQQGVAGWAQEDLDGGGNFYPTRNAADYIYTTTDNTQTMLAIDAFISSGFGTTLSIGGDIAHAITCWGFNYEDDYNGIWVTDSDDNKYGDEPRPDNLHYYDVEFNGEAWHLQDYVNSNNNYITGVLGLDSIPEPSTFSIFALIGGIASLRRWFFSSA